MPRTTKREAVYAAIDSERDYQDRRWNPETTSSGGLHEVGAYLLFMQDYLDEARHQISRGADPEASRLALNTIRKITTLGVVCMEEHGAPMREPLATQEL